MGILYLLLGNVLLSFAVDTMLSKFLRLVETRVRVIWE